MQPAYPLILTLDLATITGWAIGRHGQRPVSGSVRLTSKPHAKIGSMGAALMDHVHALWIEHEFDRVVVEAPLITTKGMDRTRQALGLAGIVELWGYRRTVPVREAPASTVRKQVLGRGTFPKGEAKSAVMAWAEAAGYRPQDDNEADALALLHYAVSHEGGGTGA
jgi:crossover junction endodeoxyribonuclease RuvC